MSVKDGKLWQWVIVRQNCETFVTWAFEKDDALADFAAKGYSDAWRVLRKGYMNR